ncbi:unnamed protein product [Polarella glacialis]|uniref:Uncharacterized protein n=1 Tax=Polarella glacialis TaxID=89957 RepID=A0A813H8U0_POLGL|nr:unnamed protein product [Polarella glacialis]
MSRRPRRRFRLGAVALVATAALGALRSELEAFVLLQRAIPSLVGTSWTCPQPVPLVGAAARCGPAASRLTRIGCKAGDEDEDSSLTPGSFGGSAAYITPIGPFCPFRSAECNFDSVLGLGMGELTKSGPNFATEMARIQLDMQMGQQPDLPRVRQLADELDSSYSKWQVLMTKLRYGDDFQSREYFKLTSVHMQRQGKSLEDMGQMVKYQVECMRAFADGRMPPFPPPGLDLTTPPGSSPTAAGMSSAGIQADPFDGTESIFQSKLVKDEYDAVCRDHRQLITLGERYGSFDPLGKLAFLDQLGAIQVRWDVFFARLGLVGALNPDFKEQSQQFLSSMGLEPLQFRSLIDEAHLVMRREAESERLT